MSSVAERFWQKVEWDSQTVPGMASACWEWNGAVDNQGYPRFKYKGASALANRVRFLLDGVHIVADDHVVSFCQNKLCVRPEHHALGTDKDARALGAGGHIGPGGQYLARTLFSKGEIDVPTLAECYGISERVAEAIIMEGHQQ